MNNPSFRLTAEVGGGLHTGTHNSAAVLNRQRWARITGRSSPGTTPVRYSWDEQTPYDLGFIAHDAGMSTSVTKNPAVEPNGRTLNVGDYVKVRRGYFDPQYDWVFYVELGGQGGTSGSTLTVREWDGFPSITTSILEVPNSSLLDLGSGVARLLETGYTTSGVVRRGDTENAPGQYLGSGGKTITGICNSRVQFRIDPSLTNDQQTYGTRIAAFAYIWPSSSLPFQPIFYVSDQTYGSCGIVLDPQTRSMNFMDIVPDTLSNRGHFRLDFALTAGEGFGTNFRYMVLFTGSPTPLPAAILSLGLNLGPGGFLYPTILLRTEVTDPSIASAAYSIRPTPTSGTSYGITLTNFSVVKSVGGLVTEGGTLLAGTNITIATEPSGIRISAASASLTVEDADGVPSYSGISTIQAGDYLDVSQPSAGVARIDSIGTPLNLVLDAIADTPVGGREHGQFNIEWKWTGVGGTGSPGMDWTATGISVSDVFFRVSASGHAPFQVRYYSGSAAAYVPIITVHRDGHVRIGNVTISSTGNLVEGDIVIPNNKSYRAENNAGSDTKPLLRLHTNDALQIYGFVNSGEDGQIQIKSDGSVFMGTNPAKPHGIGTSTQLGNAWLSIGSSTLAGIKRGMYLADVGVNPNADDFGYGADFGATFTRASSGTHSEFATVRINKPVGGDSSPGGGLTDFATLIIEDQPSVGTNNYALLFKAGKIGIKEGTNKAMGVSTLVAGAVTVTNTLVTANTRILLVGQNNSGTAGTLYISARTAGTSFTITSTSGTDTRDVLWLLIEP